MAPRKKNGSWLIASIAASETTATNENGTVKKAAPKRKAPQRKTEASKPSSEKKAAPRVKAKTPSPAATKAESKSASSSPIQMISTKSLLEDFKASAPEAVKREHDSFVALMSKKTKAKVETETLLEDHKMPLKSEIYISLYRFRYLIISPSKDESLGENYFRIKSTGTSTENLNLNASSVGMQRSLTQLLKEKDNKLKQQDSLDIEIIIPEKFCGDIRLRLESQSSCFIDPALAQKIIIQSEKTNTTIASEEHTKTDSKDEREITAILSNEASLSLVGSQASLSCSLDKASVTLDTCSLKEFDIRPIETNKDDPYTFQYTFPTGQKAHDCTPKIEQKPHGTVAIKGHTVTPDKFGVKYHDIEIIE